MNQAEGQRLEAYLSHVVSAVSSIAEYTAGMDFDAFQADRKTQDAVIRNLEVIGEACNSVVSKHAAFAADHAEVPWTAAYRMRNALAHGYYKVDLSIVWQTIHSDLPALDGAIKALLGNLGASGP